MCKSVEDEVERKGRAPAGERFDLGTLENTAMEGERARGRWGCREDKR